MIKKKQNKTRNHVTFSEKVSIPACISFKVARLDFLGLIPPKFEH